MHDISDEAFEKIIAEAIDSLPEDRVKGLQNVLITFEDQPSPEQHTKLKLRGNQTLFGLYEGIPLTKRASASSLFSGMPMTMPDRITLFKLPILHYASDLEAVKEQVKKTVWHEIAHYYGLDHDEIHKREN